MSETPSQSVRSVSRPSGHRINQSTDELLIHNNVLVQLLFSLTLMRVKKHNHLAFHLYFCLGNII
jgi:hypothetical protein